MAARSTLTMLRQTNTQLRSVNKQLLAQVNALKAENVSLRENALFWEHKVAEIEHPSGPSQSLTQESTGTYI